MSAYPKPWPWRETLACLAIVAACLGAQARADVDGEKLANLVRQDCGSCHGLTMKGGLGKPLTVRDLDRWDRDQLAHIILEGVPGTAMPPWRPLLSEREARWIAEQLKQGTLQ